MKTTIKNRLIVAIMAIQFLNGCKKDNQIIDNNNGYGVFAETPATLAGKYYIPSIPTENMPVSYFLNMPPAGNQGMQGSCASWTTGYAGMSYFMNKNNLTNYEDNSRLCSPRFLYNQVKVNNDCVNSGSYLSANLNLLMQKGICTLEDMPYDAFDCSILPNNSQLQAASFNKIHSWQRVDHKNINMVKSCLIAERPVFIAFKVYESFIRLQYPYLLSSSSGDVKSAHAVTVIGYDDNRQAFKILNSWGAEWGENGCFWISYNHFKDIVYDCLVAFPLIINPNDNITTGLVLYLPFNGNANDASGNGLNGIVSSATLTSDKDGLANRAYNFDESNSSYIKIPTKTILNNITGNYSISFWLKIKSHSANGKDGALNTSWQTIFYKGASTAPATNYAFKFSISSTNYTFGCYMGGASINNNAIGFTFGLGPNTQGDWHHYLISKNGSKFRYFVDGVNFSWEQDYSTVGLFSAGSGYDLYIGKNNFINNENYFSGSIDEFRIYNRALTDSEVMKIYNL